MKQLGRASAIRPSANLGTLLASVNGRDERAEVERRVARHDETAQRATVMLISTSTVA